MPKRITNGLDWTSTIRSSLYIMAQIIQRVGTFLLLPLVIAHMTAAEFSRYGLLNSVLILMSPLITLNIYTAPARLYFDYKSPAKQHDLLYTAFLSTSGLSIGILIVVILVLQVFGIIEPVTMGSFGIQGLIAVSLMMLMVTDFGAVLMRIEGRANLFLIMSILRQLFLLGGFVVLVPRMPSAFDAFLVVYAISAVFSAVITLWLYRQTILTGNLQLPMLRDLLVYSAPTVIHVTAWWFILSSGRWIGQLYLSLDALAPYTLVTQITLITNMFSRALFEARLPDIGHAFAANQYQTGVRIINITVLIGILLLFFLYGGLYILVFILKIDLPTGYQPTHELVLFAFLGALFDVLYLRGVQINQGLKRTDLQAAITVISGITTVCLSFPLTARFADTGLILAFAFGIALQALISNIIARHTLRNATDCPADKL